MTTKDDGTMRSFSTGATRDTGEGKLEFDGFIAVELIEQFAKFMNMNRLQSDGKLRNSDNWQKGIPNEVCLKSHYRHFFESWKISRQFIDLEDQTFHVDWMNRQDYIEFVAALMGQVFNIQCILKNMAETCGLVDFDGTEPTPEMKERQDKIAEDKEEGAVLDKGNYLAPAWNLQYHTQRARPVRSLEYGWDVDEPCSCCPGDCDC